MASENQAVEVCKKILEGAGYNVDTPIVDALIGNLMGTLPSGKPKESVKCDLCNCELPFYVALMKHVNGYKHKKKLKSLCLLKEVRLLKDEGIFLGDETFPNEIRCDICSVILNSPLQLAIHLSGFKHKKNRAKAKNEHRIKHDSDSSLEPIKKKLKLAESKLLTCNSCRIVLNSPTQYNEHVSSKKHLAKKKIMRNYNMKIAGKRKFSRN